MTRDEITALIREAATKHGLPAEIMLGIAERETNFDTFAVRYEPGFLARYVMAQYNEGKLNVTETYTRAMSFGIFQCMGQTAREAGFDGKYLTQLCDPIVGIEIGCRIFERLFKAAAGDVNTALLRWNGGSNPNYSGEVMMLALPYSHA